MITSDRSSEGSAGEAAHSLPGRYTAAAALGALAAAARLGLAPWVGDQFVLATGFLAAVAASWFGGFGPSLATLALSYLLITFALPAFAPDAAGPSPPMGLALYAASGLGVAWLGGRVRSAVAAAAMPVPADLEVSP